MVQGVKGCEQVKQDMKLKFETVYSFFISSLDNDGVFVCYVYVWMCDNTDHLHVCYMVYV